MKKEEVEILKIIQNFGKEIKVNPFLLETFGLDSSFEKDLGLDSLSKMELIAKIETHFKVSFPESLIASFETPRDLLRSISGGKGEETTQRHIELKREFVSSFPGKSSTLIGVLEYHFKNHPDLPHVKICHDNGEEEILTYRDLWEESGKFAKSLIENFKIQPGNTVAIMLPMGGDYFFSFFGIMRAGAIPVPLYPPYNLRQINTHILRHCNILENCQAIMLITLEDAKSVSEIIQSKVESLKTVVTPTELNAQKGSVDLHIDPNSIAFIQYTSGSTGTPKGVILTHQNLLANVSAMGRALEVTSKDVFVSWLPLYHDMGLIGAWFGCLYHSSLLVIMSPLSFLAHPIKWLRTIQKNKGTLTAAPNFAYELCLKRIDENDLLDLDLSSIRVMFNGAEQVVPLTLKNFSNKFSKFGLKPHSLMPVYGLAENSLGLTFPKLSSLPFIDSINREKFLKNQIALKTKDQNSLKFVSCGFPLEDYQVRIVDELGNDLPERNVGKIQFKGPSASSGYYKNPEATRKLFEGNWLNTGDIGYLAEGELFITGRIKDLIIHGGRNIFPEEIEQAIGEIEGIRKGCVAAFGSFDPQKGTERLVIVAETREKDKKVMVEMQKKINSIVSSLIGSAPEVVLLAPPHSVLKTLNGKIRRSATRELFEREKIGKGEGYIWLFYLEIIIGKFLNLFKIFTLFLKKYAYTFYFWAMIFFIGVPSTILVIIIPFENLRWPFMRLSIKILSKLLGISASISGIENLKTKSILVSNHASYLDGFLLIMSLPIKISFVAKGELKNNPFFKLLLNRLNTKFVERFDFKRGTEDLKRMISNLPTDRPVLFFPEGTFVQKPGILPFKMGAFLLSTETNLPIIPISIRGSRNILADEIWIPKKGIVNIIISEAILGDKEKAGWERAIELSNLARNQILLHCGEPDLSHEKSPLEKMRV